MFPPADLLPARRVGVRTAAKNRRQVVKKANLRQRLLKKQDGLCYYCMTAISIKTITFDHRVPVSRGGGNGSNIVGACGDCNNAKGNRTEREFITHLPLALNKESEMR